MRKLLFLFVGLIAASFMFAGSREKKQSASCVGHIYDKISGNELIGARIFLLDNKDSVLLVKEARTTAQSIDFDHPEEAVSFETSTYFISVSGDSLLNSMYKIKASYPGYKDEIIELQTDELPTMGPYEIPDIFMTRGSNK